MQEQRPTQRNVQGNQQVTPDVDVTVVVRTRDDEERCGATLARLGRHLRSLGISFEILVADEGSGDNSVAVAVMMKKSWPQIEVLHAQPGRGWLEACRRARGRALLLYDVRSDAPLASLGYALERTKHGADVVAVHKRYVVLRRVRALRAFDALVLSSRDPRVLEKKLLRRAKGLGLEVAVTHATPRRSPWAALRHALLAPLSVRL